MTEKDVSFWWCIQCDKALLGRELEAHEHNEFRAAIHIKRDTKQELLQRLEA